MIQDCEDTPHWLQADPTAGRRPACASEVAALVTDNR
jgi:hypothetical protein